MQEVKNHYDWLDRHIETIFRKVGINTNIYSRGIVSAHGDKCYSYKQLWSEYNIPFHHGVAIYLIGRCNPFRQETSQDGVYFCDIDKWVVKNYKRFKQFLPSDAY